jgi:hypothetical protein
MTPKTDPTIYSFRRLLVLFDRSLFERGYDAYGVRRLLAARWHRTHITVIRYFSKNRGEDCRRLPPHFAADLCRLLEHMGVAVRLQDYMDVLPREGEPRIVQPTAEFFAGLKNFKAATRRSIDMKQEEKQSDKQE